MKNLSRVTILGRTNVGKSALFNRLSSTVKSLIFDEQGVTRDYVKDEVSWKGKTFELVDSAGLSLRKSSDPLLDKVRLTALNLLNSSQVIIFVVDGKSGILPEDYEISKHIHKSGKKVILAVNKIDTNAAQEQLYEFDKLGYDTIIPISALHGTAIHELLDAIVVALADESGVVETKKVGLKIVLLGKPNVGKSSLMNMLLKEERSLVTDIPGTTREAISERIQFFKETIEITDTPGIRRKKTIDLELEGMMVKSAFRAVRDADIILLLLDASEGKISDQELKLAYYAFDDQKKGVILLFNKQDITDEEAHKDLDFSLSEHKHLMKKLVSLNISAKTGKNVGSILPTVQKVWDRYTKEFSQEELVVLFKQALIRTPLYRSGSPILFKTVKQIRNAPITIVFFATHPTWFGPSQLAFFENVLRGATDLRGAPIQFIVRKG
jgi:GTP-binding protein